MERSQTLINIMKQYAKAWGVDDEETMNELEEEMKQIGDQYDILEEYYLSNKT